MTPPIRILGISAYYHDSAAALLVDGQIVAAASEERFTRQKGDSRFPTHAVAYCLREGGIATGDLTAVGFYEKPLLKFDRILETFVGAAPRGFSQFAWPAKPPLSIAKGADGRLPRRLSRSCAEPGSP